VCLLLLLLHRCIHSFAHSAAGCWIDIRTLLLRFTSHTAALCHQCSAVIEALSALHLSGDNIPRHHNNKRHRH